MTRKMDTEIRELQTRLAALRARKKEASQPRSAEDIPGRTEEGRFLPSTRIAYQLLEVAERSQLADISSVEEDRTEQHDIPEAAEHVRGIISRALDRVLYTQARSAAARGRTLTTVATASGEFADGVASALTQQLSLNPYEAPAFLGALHRDLAEVLQAGPITYAWGELAYDIQMQLTTTAEAKRPDRTTPRATFYRDTADL